MTNSNLTNLAPIMAEVIRGWLNEQPAPEQPQPVELTPNEISFILHVLREHRDTSFSSDCMDENHPMNRMDEIRATCLMIDRLEGLT